jgi:elongation factor Ts
VRAALLFYISLHMVSMDVVKQLRDETGISVLQCKKALEEAEGDVAKAKEVLQALSASSAEKKADRTLGAGVIQAYVHATHTSAGVAVLACETDFVARNPEFIAIAKDLAMHVCAMQPENLEAMLEQPFVKDGDRTVKIVIDQATQKFGEKVALTRAERIVL